MRGFLPLSLGIAIQGRWASSQTYSLVRESLVHQNLCKKLALFIIRFFPMIILFIPRGKPSTLIELTPLTTRLRGYPTN